MILPRKAGKRVVAYFFFIRTLTKVNLIPTIQTNSKKLLAYKLLKIASLSNGKVLYGLHLAIFIQAPSSDLPNHQDLIDAIWQEMLHLPAHSAIQGIKVKPIKKLPLDHEDEIDLGLSFHNNKEYFDRIAPYLGKPNSEVYTLFVGLVTDNRSITAEQFLLNPQ